MAALCAAPRGAPRSRTLAPAFVRAPARPDPCMANGPCTDRARVRTNRALQPTAEDDTHIHAHLRFSCEPCLAGICAWPAMTMRKTRSNVVCGASQVVGFQHPHRTVKSRQ
eukprot:2762750-Prymnesium_polylepis.1